MVNLVNEAMDMLHDQSLPTIELLQSSFPNGKDFMMNISTLLDPRYVFLIYAPILFALNKRVGHRTIIALTLTEWANQILKWLLAGERPYWYVHERANELAIAQNSSTGIESYDMAAILNAPPQQPITQLKQFPVTCELGAGSPSGHAMVTATVWYILIDAYLRGEITLFGLNKEPEPRSLQLVNKLARISWGLYTLVLVLVSLSRVYLACHFPHQCLCGAILGVAVARLVIERIPMESLSKGHFCAATGFMFASALGTYFMLRMLGVDPLWSVGKGMRWCVKKEYIHLDTTPFFSMMRYLGFCLGAGLAYDANKISFGRLRQATSSSLSNQTASSTSTTYHLLAIRRLATALVSIAFGQFLMSLPLPRANLNLFYLISFIMYTIFSYSIAAPIPKLSKQAWQLQLQQQPQELKQQQQPTHKLKAH